MTAPNYLQSLARTLKRTLKTIQVDKSMASNLVLNKYCSVSGMEDAWEDDLDIAGPGLASLKPEGQEITPGFIQEGVKWRYTAQTYAIECQASRELLADGKYEKAIDMQRFNREAIMLTCDYLAVTMLMNRSDSNYLGGDGVVLASASHPVTRGGTYSNVLATPAGPSTGALDQVTQNLAVMPGRDGLIRPVHTRKVVHPSTQIGVWRRILESSMDPTAGNFTAINTAKGGDGRYERVEVPYWQGAPDDWAVLTDAGKGLEWRWRERPTSNSWVEWQRLITIFIYHMRVAYGWSDPRGIYFGGSTS